MKRYGVARVSMLMTGFAISSPKAMAQMTPAADLPHVDAVAATPGSIAVHPEPILIYTHPSEKEKLRFYEFDAFGPFAFEFIHGGPHTLFSHMRGSKSQGGTTVAQNPN